MNEGINKKEKIWTKEEAEKEIGYITTQVNVMGANHSEIPDLNRLLERLKNGECSPHDAVVIARSILHSKQDYH